jgi:anti-sigma B factor antagonist
MNRKTVKPDGSVPLVIEGEMTISRAAELKQILLPACIAGMEVEIDLSRVSEIDASGLQLMVAVKLESIARGAQLKFIGHSAAVQDALELSGLGGFFGDPLVITSAPSPRTMP